MWRPDALPRYDTDIVVPTKVHRTQTRRVMDFDQLTDSSSEASNLASGFWRRQFSSDVTEAQSAWDIFFGMIAPVLCFILDPFVFKGSMLLNDGLVPDYQLFAYAVTFFQIISLLGWFLIGRR